MNMSALLPRLRHLRPSVAAPLLRPSLAASRPYSSKAPPKPSPAPPRLPEKEQAEFEALLKKAEGMTPAVTARDAEDPWFAKERPAFEGEVNPKTGEAGGPKTEPLKWGGEGDWSYNGKVTDF